MAKSRIAVIVGSNRRDSINRKLARALAKLGADKFDASFVRIDDLAMFNQDLEGNLPEEAVRFKSELANADGVLIVTPEHDRSIPALLKNAVDWGARPYGKNSWAGKPGFITGTSPGAIGSALAQQHLRSVMVGLGMILLGGEAYVTFKPNLVDDDGDITDESTKKFLQGFLDRFFIGCAALTARPALSNSGSLSMLAGGGAVQLQWWGSTAAYWPDGYR
jgi:chromate reductase